MKKQALSLAVAIAGAYPAVSNALSLGDIESNSNLNQPLRAKIELLSANAQESRQIQVRLAPSSVFNRVGIDRPAFLDSLKFTSTVQNGKPVILITSDAPISEPFVNFLLEVSWPQGQLLKEYTVMLDPPVLLQPGNTLAGAEATVRAEPRSTGVVNRPAPVPQQPRVVAQQAAPQPQQAQPAQQPARQPQAQVAARPAPAPAQRSPVQSTTRTYRVQQGDTLFKVASRLSQPGTNVDQMMMALFRANPEAFIDGNINGLKAGAVLNAPTGNAATAVSRAEARRQVRQQYTEWKNFRSTLAKNTVPQKAADSGKPAAQKQAQTEATGNDDKARLEVLGNKDKTAAGDTVSAVGKARLTDLEKELSLARESLVTRQRENDEFKSRVDELESMLRKKNRLIALRDDQLAELQRQLAGGATGEQQVATQQQAQLANQNNPANPNNTANIPTPVTANEGNGQAVMPAQQQQPGGLDADVSAINQNGQDIQNYIANADGQGNAVVRAQEAEQAAMTPAQRAAMARMQGQPEQAAVNNTINNANNKAQNGQNDQQIEPLPPATGLPDDAAKTAGSPFADDQQNGGDDLMSLLTSPLMWKIGAGALLSLLLLWLLSRLLGRRKSAPPKQVAGLGDEHFGLNGDPAMASAAEIARNRDTKSDAYDDIGHQVEDQLDKAGTSGHQNRDDPFGMGEERGVMSGDAAAGDLVAAHPEQEEDEVLMEANVYIAYGLHQQAESELKKALEKHPDRLEYRHKLLENYFAANNREAFDQHAQAFMDTKGSDHERNRKLWKDVIGWGSKISPDNSLYRTDSTTRETSEASSGHGALAAGMAAVAGVATAAVATGKEAVQDGKDAMAHAFNPADDKDLALGKVDKPAAGLDVANERDMELALDDFSDDDLGLDDFDFDLDDLERELAESEADLDGTAVVADEMATATSLADDDIDLQEFADTLGDDADFTLDDPMAGLDEFELDLSESLSADAADKEPVAAKPEPADTGLDETIDFDFDDIPDMPVASVKAADDNEDDLLDFDLDDMLLEEENAVAASARQVANDAQHIGSKTAAVAATAAAGAVALSAGVANAGSNASSKVTSLNLHLDKETGLKKILPQDTFYTAPEPKREDDDWLGDIDDALSFLDMPDEEIDLHEAHISTKLDLARAYLDMGDIEGARSTLEEVMVEGNDNQRREAETLLHQTG